MSSDQIDYASRYASLVALCREWANARRLRLTEDMIVLEEKIDRRLVQWQELEE